jgi:P4 family phage/plasmid primase-like protien
MTKPQTTIQKRIAALKSKPKLRLVRSKQAVPEVTTLTPADLAMFARLKIPVALVEAAGIRRVTDTAARQLGIRARAAQSLDGIVFPYCDPASGEMVTLRLRRDRPEMKDGKLEGKYLCPKGGARILYVLPQSASLLKNTGAPIVLVEAEKSVLALTAWAERTQNEVLPMAMGGCWGFSQNKEAIPALDWCNGHGVIVLLDANAATNPGVQAAQEALVGELRKPERKCTVTAAALPQLDGVNGPDDLLALDSGDDLLAEVLDNATAPAALGAYSDDALALEFTKQHGDDLCYVASWGQWLQWNSRCWQCDGTLDVYSKARAVCRAAAEACGKKQTAQRIRSAQTVAAVERLAHADRQHAATVAQWDADPWLLNTPGGVVDLHTGKLRPATREDYCTKIISATPGGDCPIWRKFLADVTAGDKQLQSFLQRMCGYSLTGLTYEHALFFLYGTGANGKSVFLNTITGALGEYAKVAPIESFTASQNEGHPTDMAGLQGARLVTATETEDGRRWAESKLKSLTGGDKIAARFMRQDFFEFTPQFKLVVSGNHRPGLRSVDEAMRRRMNLVPFNVTIPAAKRDSRLAEKLRVEWPGILQWAVDGCLEWQRVGLRPPQAVTAATDAYMTAEDALGRWLDERTVKAANSRTASAELFQDWRRWAENAGEFVGPQKRFSQNLEARGFRPAKGHASRDYIGLGLSPLAAARAAGEPNRPVESFSKTKLPTGIYGGRAARAAPSSKTAPKFTRAGHATR